MSKAQIVTEKSIDKKLALADKRRERLEDEKELYILMDTTSDEALHRALKVLLTYKPNQRKAAAKEEQTVKQRKHRKAHHPGTIAKSEDGKFIYRYVEKSRDMYSFDTIPVWEKTKSQYMVVMDIDGRQYWKFKPTSKDENYLGLIGPFDAKSGLDHKDLSLSQYIINHFIHYMNFLEEPVVSTHDIYILLHDFTSKEEAGFFAIASRPYIKVSHTRITINRKMVGHKPDDIKDSNTSGSQQDITDMEEEMEVSNMEKIEEIYRVDEIQKYI